MMSSKFVAHDKLLELICYSSEDGQFFFTDGSPAEHDGGQGYLNVQVEKKGYRAHRLAWFYVYGVWPIGEIDHINGIRSDNRIKNLRDVHRSVNQQNRKAPQKNNKCGLLGVTAAGHKFKATVRVGNKSHHAGTFSSPQEAHEAYLKAKRALHPGCTI